MTKNLTGFTARRLEKQILSSCRHPAVQNPWIYNFDLSRQVVCWFLLVILGLIIWQGRLYSLNYAKTPLVNLRLTPSPTVQPIAR